MGYSAMVICIFSLPLITGAYRALDSTMVSLPDSGISKSPHRIIALRECRLFREQPYSSQTQSGGMGKVDETISSIMDLE
jgi:hypothetical protein